jgi:hypothetical protein
MIVDLYLSWYLIDGLFLIAPIKSCMIINIISIILTFMQASHLFEQIIKFIGFHGFFHYADNWISSTT